MSEPKMVCETTTLAGVDADGTVRSFWVHYDRESRLWIESLATKRRGERRHTFAATGTVYRSQRAAGDALAVKNGCGLPVPADFLARHGGAR